MTRVGDLFEVTYGHSLELNRLTVVDAAVGVPFVSRKMGDNGISAFVAPIADVAPAPSGSLSCALSGNGILSTFIQDKPFYTAFHVAVLSPKVSLSRQQLLYYCACIEANRFRYSWGRQANRTLKDIELPSVDEIPNWVHLANPDQFDGRDQPKSTAPVPKLDRSKWQEFRLGTLFTIKKGKRLTKQQQRFGHTPFLGAIESNNGVSAFIDREPIHSGGTIAVNYNGSVAEAFYQPSPFWASDDVNVLYPQGFVLTAARAMFLIALIRFEKYRFNYGRKWHLDRMRESTILLPATAAGTPDWEWMSDFIETLNYSASI